MNAADAPEVKEHLLASHDLYRELSHLHHELDDRLQQLNAQHHLSASEHIEEVTLKKRKLALKDQMMRIATDWSHAHSSA